MAFRVDPQWWVNGFEGAYLALYDSVLTPASSEAQVATIMSTFDLRPPARVLDAACGQGRHAIAFARRGFTVVGVDFSSRLLQVADERARAAGHGVRFVQADMRELEFEEEFDLVVNLYTAFGFFEDESDHERAVRAFVRALRPGGRLVLETINRDGQLRILPPIGGSELPNGTVVLERHQFDPYLGRLLTERVLRCAGHEPQQHDTSLRLFAPEELVRLFKAACLRDVSLYDGFFPETHDYSQDAGLLGSLRPYTLDSTRMCITGRK
ncbi:MAG: class I SAM-dependent methyltransferase [Candidatus Eremiobacteraeota bacterium]|nr:class I SAM-dependent methyltransferase [Candidatus Eremiobacteraeota bacterium]